MRTVIFLCFAMLIDTIAATGHQLEVAKALTTKPWDALGPILIIICIVGDITQYVERIKNIIK